MSLEPQYKIRLEHLSFFYGDYKALDDVSLEVREHEIFGLMGPSKSGKSTLLKVLNRMSDLVPEAGWRARCGWTGRISWTRLATWCPCAAGWGWS